jgi:hypothetical protein
MAQFKKKNSKFQKSFQNICDFPIYLSSNFTQYWIVFINRKDKNSVLKYPVFVKTLENKKKIIQPKLKTICVNMHFDFNNQFIKATRTNQNFKKKNSKRNHFVFF